MVKKDRAKSSSTTAGMTRAIQWGVVCWYIKILKRLQSSTASHSNEMKTNDTLKSQRIRQLNIKHTISAVEARGCPNYNNEYYSYVVCRKRRGAGNGNKTLLGNKWRKMFDVWRNEYRNNRSVEIPSSA